MLIKALRAAEQCRRPYVPLKRLKNRKHSENKEQYSLSLIDIDRVIPSVKAAA